MNDTDLFKLLDRTESLVVGVNSFARHADMSTKSIGYEQKEMIKEAIDNLLLILVSN
jgi:hypothetical protein